MKRGLVIGKFMPLHKGHIALIHFAADQCDELIVSMTFKHSDPIPGPLRFSWIEKEFKSNPKIKPEISVDDFDDETLSWEDRIPLWVEFLKKRFPKIDCVFSSEMYGNLISGNLGIPHIRFDPTRKKFPISSTLIRESPLMHWKFIATSARGFFVKKICFYGPESTGKTTMAKKLAEVYHTEFVPEVSREIVTSNVFTADDIVRIGHAQTERVKEKLETANKLLFCDSDVITTEIYSDHYLQVIPPVLFELEKQITYDRYYFFDIDVPWIADDIRDLGEKRVEMADVFKAELDKRKITYSMVQGNYGERELFLRKEMDALIHSS